MNSKIQDLCQRAQALFSKRTNLLDYWQSVGENFYTERADFTVTRELGDELMDYLTTSYPVIARRDLGDGLASMLRSSDWFAITVEEEEGLDKEGKEWLQWATGTLRRAMYDRLTMFTRATKQGDHDFAAFGQTVISTELNTTGERFLYKCHHLRDMAWIEDDEGQICMIVKKWEPEVRNLKKKFPKPGAIHPHAMKMMKDKADAKIECFHIVMKTEDYDSDTNKWIQPWVSLYVDKGHNHVIEEAGSWSRIYDIPRWQTVSGSQYAYSPATVCALPDARLIQAVTLTLLDAGERGARPPILAVGEAIQSDVNLVPDGITVVDIEYDERTGDALRPLAQDRGGMPYSFEIRDDIRAMISEAFYLNKLTMPAAEIGREMTAFEVGQRVEEYVRNALPLFEPMEHDYNGSICMSSFELGFRNGLFGPPQTIPRSLQNRDVQFKFQSPLTDAKERKKGTAFMETSRMLATAAEMDPNAPKIVNVQAALRDALEGIGSPVKWTRDEDEMAQIMARDAAQRQAAAEMAAIGEGAAVAEQVGTAGEQMMRVQEMAEQ